jgi:ubiquinone/menaquinone biosynthesis C-methylase UbiE
MDNALDSFDRIAGFYDALARIVFGKHIADSQRHFLDAVNDGSKVLILGGGTGWLLAELLSRKHDCEVWYVEASQRMIALSEEKTGAVKKNVHFIHGTEQSIPPGILFDFVITNFYLDLFSNESLSKVLSKIKMTMKENARWLATDFVYRGKWWQSVLLWIMYRFFRMMSSIEARSLPEWEQLTDEAGLITTQEKMFFGGFIKNAVMSKRANQ